MAAFVKRIPLPVGFALLSFICVARAQNPLKLNVSSTAFAAGAPIPIGYSCSSPNVQSPPLAWKGVPSDARTLALIVRDPDAPSGDFIHWVVYNLPAGLSGLDANVPPTATLANGGFQGRNGTGRIGYQGPCPPPGNSPHHYHFQLFALDIALGLKPGATAAELEQAMNGHVRASGELVGTFAR